MDLAAPRGMEGAAGQPAAPSAGARVDPRAPSINGAAGPAAAGARKALAIVPIYCNTPAERLRANLLANLQRARPIPAAVAPHGRLAAIVAGGPSARIRLGAIADRQRAGVRVIAVNNAAAMLAAAGIVPDCQFTSDAQPGTAEFFAASDARVLILSSAVDPATVDAALARAAVTGARVHLIHLNSEGIREVLSAAGEDIDGPFLGGGSTSGLNALALAYALGFRGLELYGFDSSYQGAAGHAYSQALNDGERVLPVTVRGREFDAAPWMIRQAQEFVKLAPMMANDFGCELRVIGDGMLPFMAHQLSIPPAPDAFVYELAAAPASYDFIAGLAIARAAADARGVKGKLRVCFLPGPDGGFREDELPGDRAERQRVLDKVMRPALKLFNAVEDPAAADGYIHAYTFRELVDLVRASKAKAPLIRPPGHLRANAARRIGKLTAWGKRRAITITLRESSHWPERNSDLAIWADVARFLWDRGYFPIAIRDTAHAHEPLSRFPATWLRASLDLRFRAAVYETAWCNLFVSNGPAALAFLSTRPWLMFRPLCTTWRPGQPEWYRRFHGVKPAGFPGEGEGDQFPWSMPAQRIVWNWSPSASAEAGIIHDGDDYAAIVDAFLAIEPLILAKEP